MRAQRSEEIDSRSAVLNINISTQLFLDDVALLAVLILAGSGNEIGVGL